MSRTTDDILIALGRAETLLTAAVLSRSRGWFRRRTHQDHPPRPAPTPQGKTGR